LGARGKGRGQKKTLSGEGLIREGGAATNSKGKNKPGSAEASAQEIRTAETEPEGIKIDNNNGRERKNGNRHLS